MFLIFHFFNCHYASVKNLGKARLSVTVDEVLPRLKHRFDLRPETGQIHNSFQYCKVCKIMGTIAAENKYSFLGGQDFLGNSIQIPACVC